MDEWDQAYIDLGYVHCRPHGEWHRPPECAIDQEGHALMWCGCRWSEDEHRPECPVYGHESADLVQGDAKLRENSGDADATENHENGSEL